MEPGDEAIVLNHVVLIFVWFQSGPKAFHDIDKSPLNQFVASANSDKLVRIWDQRSSGETIHSTILILFASHRLTWPTENTMMMSTLSSHQGWVVAVCWSPTDEYQLLSGSYDSSLRLWDIRSTKQPLYTIAAHEGKVLCCDWTLPKVSLEPSNTGGVLFTSIPNSVTCYVRELVLCRLFMYNK